VITSRWKKCLPINKDQTQRIFIPMKFTSMYISYLVRIWQDEPAGGEGEPPAWQGEVLHIQSGSKVSFEDLDHLLRYLQEQLDGGNQLES